MQLLVRNSAPLLQAVVLLLLVAAPGPAAAARQYVGPLVCSDPSCPSAGDGSGRTSNNTNFHLRDIAITAGPDGYYCKLKHTPVSLHSALNQASLPSAGPYTLRQPCRPHWHFELGGR
jgi:hypothetical protein